MTKGGKGNPKYKGQAWKPDRHAQEEMQALIYLWDASNFKVQPDKLHRVTKGREEEGYPDTFDDAVRRHAANREMTVNEAYVEVEENIIDPSDPMNAGTFIGARVGPKPIVIQCELCGFQGYNQSMFA